MRLHLACISTRLSAEQSKAASSNRAISGVIGRFEFTTWLTVDAVTPQDKRKISLRPSPLGHERLDMLPWLLNLHPFTPTLHLETQVVHHPAEPCKCRILRSVKLTYMLDKDWQMAMVNS